jgi:hypothetical protein
MKAPLNVVDSCGWLEYFANGPDADFFAPAIEAEKKLIVPHVGVFEVIQCLAHQRGESAARQAMGSLEKGRLMGLDTLGLCSAALAAQQHRLAMADAMIWQTAIGCGAQVYTQNADFMHLPHVVYRARPV